MTISTSAAVRVTSTLTISDGFARQLTQITSPLLSMLTGCLCTLKYTSVLFALPWGVRCRYARTGEFRFLMSMHSALLAVDVGAAKTRRVSWMVRVILVNFCRFTGNLIAYKLVVSYVRQSACFCVQPR